MAHKQLWYQGTTPFNPLKCDGRPEFTCPSSKRVAAEYMRDYFTLTNVLNPNTFYDNLGVESWLYKELQSVKVGDVLWLALVPPKHHVSDVFAYNEATTTEHSSLASMGGITLSLVTGIFKEADENGNCEVSSQETHGTLAMPEGAEPDEQFLRAAVDITTQPKNWVGIGFKVDALPANRTLADFVGKIVIGCHAVGYDAQTYM